MLGKVWLRAGGYAAGAYMPGDGDGRKHESQKAEHRDGKEDIHNVIRRITRCMDFVQFIQFQVPIWVEISGKGQFSGQ
jgi:hypothetical protein